jgi:UDP-N-acetylmuramyl pentapeptide synthase
LTLSARENSADIRIAKSKALGFEDRFGWEYEFATPWGEVKGRLPLPGPHNLFNAMSAAALTLASGELSIENVVKGIETPKISKLRSNLFRLTNGAVVYDDSYNSNPTSVAALFEAARLIRANNRSGLSKTVAVVGDMLELGPNSGALHKDMGHLAAKEGIDLLLATGNFANEWVAGFSAEKATKAASAAGFKNQDELMNALSGELRSNPEKILILVKGSRGAKMDQIVDRIKSAHL